MFIAMLLCMLGFIIGLGSVLVIDILGFLGRRSGYWTLATIRAHKVTKPLIWLGTSIVLLGLILLHIQVQSNITMIQVVLVLPMILNGLFLSLYVSPRLLYREAEGLAEETLPIALQQKIAGSLLLSDGLWWTQVVLFVYVVSHLV